MADMEVWSEYPEAVREFAAYKTSIQGCSPKTVAEYLVDLRMFCRYMKCQRYGLSVDD